MINSKNSLKNIKFSEESLKNIKFSEESLKSTKLSKELEYLTPKASFEKGLRLKYVLPNDQF